MNKQAFTDGYMHKQAIGPGLIRRGIQTAKPAVSRARTTLRELNLDPLGAQSRKARDWFRGSATGLQRESDDLLRRADELSGQLHRAGDRPRNPGVTLKRRAGLNTRLAAQVRQRMNKLYQDSDAAALEASGMAADASRQALKGVAHPATTATAAGATGTAGLKAGEKITEKRK